MSFWKEKIKIGTVEVPRFIAGPMDGFTDSPFRKIMRKFSPHELLYTEIAHVSTIVHAPENTNIFRFEQSERPLNFQITANKFELIDVACQKILASGVDMVDLNIGCPARNVVGSGSGSALMGDIPRLIGILRQLRKHLSVPFTVKMRAGFKEHNALDIARLTQDEGVDAIVVHPRLQKHKFSGKPDYSLVAEIKKNISIPVIISGDIVDVESAKNVYEQTGVDGFMVSRALRGAPWKLKELSMGCLDKEYRVTSESVHRTALDHLDAILDYYGTSGLYMFRKHLSCYIKGGPDACEFRSRLMIHDSVDAVKDEINSFFRTQSD